MANGGNFITREMVMKGTERTKTQPGGVPPRRRGKTAIATAERPRPSKEQIIAAIKGMTVQELLWLRKEIEKLIRGGWYGESRR